MKAAVVALTPTASSSCSSTGAMCGEVRSVPSDSANGVWRSTSTLGDRIPQLTIIVPATMPVTMEMVASPSPMSTTSGAPTLTRISPMPAIVPWPPANDISNSPPAAGLRPKTGVSSSATAKPPSANCPNEYVEPRMKCGADRSHSAPTLGSRLPIMIAPNTTLMSRPVAPSGWAVVLRTRGSSARAAP